MEPETTREVAIEPVEQPQEIQEVSEDTTEHVQEVAETQPEPSTSEPQAEELELEAEEPEFNPADYTGQQYEIPQVRAIDPNQFVDQATGEIDWMSYNQAQEQRLNDVQQQAAAMAQNAVRQATQQMELKSRYEQEWRKAEDRFPELKSNRQLKDMVNAIHNNSARPGAKYLSPAKAAEQLFSVRGEAKAQGMKAAQETRSVQAAATLGSPNPPVQARSNESSSAKDRMLSGSPKEREAAAKDVIADMVRRGVL